MQIVKEKLEIDEELEKKINNLLKFTISLITTNIAYIEPHKLEINEITYLLFNECEDVYINNLNSSIPLKELEGFIKCTF